jgi:hypothetical protein
MRNAIQRQTERQQNSGESPQDSAEFGKAHSAVKLARWRCSGTARHVLALLSRTVSRFRMRTVPHLAKQWGGAGILAHRSLEFNNHFSAHAVGSSSRPALGAAGRSVMRWFPAQSLQGLHVASRRGIHLAAISPEGERGPRSGPSGRSSFVICFGDGTRRAMRLETRCPGLGSVACPPEVEPS